MKLQLPTKLTLDTDNLVPPCDMKVGEVYFNDGLFYVKTDEHVFCIDKDTGQLFIEDILDIRSDKVYHLPTGEISLSITSPDADNYSEYTFEQNY